MKKKVLRRETSKVIIIGVVLFILRWLPVNPYNKLFNKLVASIHKEALPMYVIDLVDIVKFSPKVSKVYKNSAAEYEALKVALPSIKNAYSVLYNRVVASRKKYGLPQ